MALEQFEQEVVQASFPIYNEPDYIFASGDDDYRRSDCDYNEDGSYEGDARDISQYSQKQPDSFYIEWESELSGTYAGIYIDDATMASLFTILTGRGGYFMLVGAVAAGKSDNSSISPSLAAGASSKTQRQMDYMVGILDPLLEKAGIPWDKRRQKSDEIVEELRANFSGKQNEMKRKEKKLSLGIGNAALKQVS